MGKKERKNRLITQDLGQYINSFLFLLLFNINCKRLGLSFIVIPANSCRLMLLNVASSVVLLNLLVYKYVEKKKETNLKLMSKCVRNSEKMKLLVYFYIKTETETESTRF